MTGQSRVKQEQMSDEPMRSRKRPEWAAGLRQLYDSVVEEPLPDTFSDLLSRFDESDSSSPSRKEPRKEQGSGSEGSAQDPAKGEGA